MSRASISRASVSRASMSRASISREPGALYRTYSNSQKTSQSYDYESLSSKNTTH